MAFIDSYSKKVTEILNSCPLEKYDYLSVNAKNDGNYSYKFYKRGIVNGLTDPCSNALYNSGIPDSFLSVSCDNLGVHRNDFHICNQRNTNKNMTTILNILRNSFSIDSESMREIINLAKMPILLNRSGYRSLYQIGIESENGIPTVLKLHFRTRMSVYYKDYYMNDMYLDYLQRTMPEIYSIPCYCAKTALLCGDLFIVGVDYTGNEINKRKIYIKINDIRSVSEVIAKTTDKNSSFADFYSELYDAVSKDNRLFIDGFSYCFYGSKLGSINYYLGVNKSCFTE